MTKIIGIAGSLRRQSHGHLIDKTVREKLRKYLQGFAKFIG